MTMNLSADDKLKYLEKDVASGQQPVARVPNTSASSAPTAIFSPEELAHFHAFLKDGFRPQKGHVEPDFYDQFAQQLSNIPAEIRPKSNVLLDEMQKNANARLHPAVVIAEEINEIRQLLSKGVSEVRRLLVPVVRSKTKQPTTLPKNDYYKARDKRYRGGLSAQLDARDNLVALNEILATTRTVKHVTNMLGDQRESWQHDTHDILLHLRPPNLFNTALKSLDAADQIPYEEVLTNDQEIPKKTISAAANWVNDVKKSVPVLKLYNVEGGVIKVLPNDNDLRIATSSNGKPLISLDQKQDADMGLVYFQFDRNAKYAAVEPRAGKFSHPDTDQLASLTNTSSITNTYTVSSDTLARMMMPPSRERPVNANAESLFNFISGVMNTDLNDMALEYQPGAKYEECIIKLPYKTGDFSICARLVIINGQAGMILTDITAKGFIIPEALWQRHRGKIITAEMIKSLIGSSLAIKSGDGDKIVCSYNAYQWQREGRRPSILERVASKLMDVQIGGVGKKLRGLSWFQSI